MAIEGKEATAAARAHLGEAMISWLDQISGALKIGLPSRK